MRLGILVSGTGVDKRQPCSVLFENGKGKARLAGRKSFMGKWCLIVIKYAFQRHLVIADWLV